MTCWAHSFASAQEWCHPMGACSTRLRKVVSGLQGKFTRHLPLCMAQHRITLPCKLRLCSLQYRHVRCPLLGMGTGLARYLLGLYSQCDDICYMWHHHVGTLCPLLESPQIPPPEKGEPGDPIWISATWMYAFSLSASAENHLHCLHPFVQGH